MELLIDTQKDQKVQTNKEEKKTIKKTVSESKVDESIRSPLKLAIVLFTNIGVGAGTEVVAKELSRAMVEKNFASSVSIVQTDYMFTASTNNWVGEVSNKKIKLLNFTSPYNNILYSFFSKYKPLTYLFNIIYPIMYIISNSENLKFIWETNDRIYLVYWLDALIWSLVGKNVKKIVVSNQCGISEKKLFLKFLRKKNIHSLTYLTKRDMAKNALSSFLKYVIPNGVRSEEFLPSLRIENSFETSFLFLSRLDHTKGISELLQAADMLGHEPWFNLTIVGTGEYSDILSNSKNPKINFKGYVPYEKLPEIYSSSDVFIFPSYGETFGNVVIEAVSCGVFVLLSSKLKGIFDDLEELGAIRYIEIDPVSIANEITKLKGFHLSKSKKLEFHKYIQDHYDWSSIALKLYEMIKD